MEVAKAAERRRTEFHGTSHAGVQTEPVAFASEVPVSPSRTGALVPLHTFTGAICDQEQDMEQMEAIQTLARLGEIGNRTEATEARVSELSVQVQAERHQGETVRSQLALERTAKEATKDQVICLEKELDNRESALQAAEDALHRRTAELQQAMLQIQVLQDGYGCVRGNGLLRAQLNEKELELETKDRYISRLLALLRTRGVYLEDESLTCGYSDRNMMSMAMAVSTAGCLGQYPRQKVC